MEIKPETPVRQGSKMSSNENGNGEKKIMSDLQRFVALIFTIIATTAGAMLYYTSSMAAVVVRVTAIEVQAKSDKQNSADRLDALQRSGTELAQRDHDTVIALVGVIPRLSADVAEIKTTVNNIQQSTNSTANKLEEHLRESKPHIN